MRKTLTALLALALTLALAVPALAQETAPARNALVVTGSATVSLQADTATIELGAQTRGRTVAEAHAENIRIMEKVIAELEKLGVAKEDIRTSQYYVYFEPAGAYGQTSPDAPGMYSVTNMLYITLRDINKVSQAIDIASAAGANNVYNLMFQSSKADEAYQRALRNAVEDARTTAQTLASATGNTLGEIVRIEASQNFGIPFAAQNRMALDSAQASTPIISGDVSVTASVTLTFAFGME
ncbi:MAG TPA: SIMPL domain-containing protein [Candidatus Limnocylindria bacterium]|nr:SIMPL domain-containing protein [Candidatus Limnocylindria bacterium]